MRVMEIEPIDLWRIISTADGGCPYCVEDLVRKSLDVLTADSAKAFSMWLQMNEPEVFRGIPG